jgi:hypothetical protein
MNCRSVCRGIDQFREDILDRPVSVADGFQGQPRPVPRVHFPTEHPRDLANIEDEAVSLRPGIAAPLASDAVLAIERGVFGVRRE